MGAAAGLAFSHCASGELGDLVERLDQEFIAGRGRTVSLARRFPFELSTSNLDNLFVARDAGRIVAVIVVKRFRWMLPQQERRGAMLGMVWTAPAKRGMGVGSQLLSHVGGALRGSADFAVLWTANPAFYARAGWKGADRGCLGRIDGNSGPAAAPAAIDFERVRAIWGRGLRRIVRDRSWRPPLPTSAESLELYQAPAAYALAGRRGATLYCYEMLGNEAGFAALLKAMRANCSTLYFNENAGSPAHGWLSDAGVRWEQKPLAMWLALGDVDPVASGEESYIPWLDRI